MRLCKMWFNLEMNLQRWSYQTSIYNLKLSFLISCFLNEDAKSTFCILKKFQMKKRKEFVYLNFVLNGLAKIRNFYWTSILNLQFTPVLRWCICNRIFACFVVKYILFWNGILVSSRFPNYQDIQNLNGNHIK